MTNFAEIATIPAIAAVVYTLMEIAKTALGGDESFKRFIPLIACILGAVSGVICFYFIPGVMQTENILVAIIIGAASGLSSTGANQVVKQLSGNKEADNKTADEATTDGGKEVAVEIHED